MSQNKVTVLATYANDILLDETGDLIRWEKGGPALYIERAFKKSGLGFEVKTGATMEVRILMRKDGEFGKVAAVPKPQPVRFSEIRTPYLLISTVLDEFDLSGLENYAGKVFLDIQGYVRSEEDFGKKKQWLPDEKTFNNIFCLKATAEELRNIPEQLIERQKLKMLIITRGDRGWEVFAFGKRYAGKPKTIVSTNNTLGAGDTFIASFVSKFMEEEDAFRSAEFASEQTAAFLASRNMHHHT